MNNQNETRESWEKRLFGLVEEVQSWKFDDEPGVLVQSRRHKVEEDDGSKTKP